MRGDPANDVKVGSPQKGGVVNDRIGFDVFGFLLGDENTVKFTSCILNNFERSRDKGALSSGPAAKRAVISMVFMVPVRTGA